MRWIRHLGFGVDDFVHPLDRGPRQLRHDHDLRQCAGRGRHGGDVCGEREERADGDPVVQGQVPAERHDTDEAELGDRCHRRREPSVDPGGSQTLGVQRASEALELIHRPGFLSEALDHPHTGHGLLDVLGEVGGALLGGPRGREQCGPHQVHDEGDRGHHHERNEGQQRREPRHDHQREDELQHHARRHGHHREQPLDELQVGDRPRHHLAGADLVLAAAVEPLQGAEQAQSQVVLHVEGQPSREHSSPVLASEPDDAEERDERGDARDDAGGGGFAARRRIDRDLREQREHDVDERRHRRHRERAHGGPPVAEALRGESSYPAAANVGDRCRILCCHPDQR